MAGSDNRQRHHQYLVRLTQEEHEDISAKADDAGISPAAFFRLAALGTPGPRAQRRPPADHVAIRQILGQCGSIGNNINQIARHLNTGGKADIPEVKEACRTYLQIRNAIFTALNMKTPHDHQGKSPK